MSALEEAHAKYERDNLRVPIAIALLEKQKAEVQDWLNDTDGIWASQDAKDKAVSYWRSVNTHLTEFYEHQVCITTNQFCVGCRNKANRLLGEEQ